MRVFFLVVLAGCYAAPEPYNTEVDPPPGLEIAAQVAASEWFSRLNIEISIPLPEIRYFAGCLIYPHAYMRQEWYAGCIEGRIWYYGDEAHIKELGGFHRDALAHELLHWALHIARGDGNSEHDDPLWLEVDDVRRLLERAEQFGAVGFD